MRAWVNIVVIAALGAMLSLVPLAGLAADPAAPAPAANAAAPSPAEAAALEGDRSLDLLDRGEIAAAGGEFAKARQLWEQALKVRPGWTTAQRRLAELPTRERNYPAQIAEIERRQDASLEFVEGVNLFNQRRWMAAAAAFDSVLTVLTDHPLAREYRDVALRQQFLDTHGALLVEANLPAQVAVDGQPRGRTPLALSDLPVGWRTVNAQAAGRSQTQRVLIKARTRSIVPFRF
ncbi:MAG: hypothetical protein KQJ78_19645 [Deltaproteobacteria bacterium]|nr:hypothetical protein [Deltaproteobacteria bacterium]